MKKVITSFIGIIFVLTLVGVISAANGADMGTKTVSINGDERNVKVTFDSEASVLVRIDNIQRALILQRNSNDYQFRDGQTKVADMYFIITQIDLEVSPAFVTSAETIAFFKEDQIAGDSLSLDFEGQGFNVDIVSVQDDSVKVKVNSQEKEVALQKAPPYNFELVNGLYIIPIKIVSFDNSSIATLFIGHDMVFGKESDDSIVDSDNDVEDELDEDIGNDDSGVIGDDDDETIDDSGNGNGNGNAGKGENDGQMKISREQAITAAKTKLNVEECNAVGECMADLKDIGKSGNVKNVYEVMIQKQSRFLGIFKKNMNIKASVDAETGEVKVDKPWWAFLASE